AGGRREVSADRRGVGLVREHAGEVVVVHVYEGVAEDLGAASLGTDLRREVQHGHGGAGTGERRERGRGVLGRELLGDVRAAGGVGRSAERRVGKEGGPWGPR